MTEQLDLPFVYTAKRREQLLLDVEFDKRNAVLLAALLREIAKYPPGECYPSQATLARAFKVSEKTVQRAVKILMGLDLVAVEPRGRAFKDGTKTINHYFINWTALEQRVHAQKCGDIDAPADAPIGQPVVLSTDRTVRPDRSDSYATPIGQLGPTDRTARCPPIGLIENQIDQTTTNGKSVVVGEGIGFLEEEQQDDTVDPSWTPTETERIRDTLRDANLHARDKAIATVQSWHWSVSDVDAHLAAWREKHNGRPEVIANWMLREGSAPPEILNSIRRKQINAEIVSSEKQRDPGCFAAYKRFMIARDGTGRGLPKWLILAMTGRSLENEEVGERATDDERSAAIILGRFDNLQAHPQSTAELQTELKRLACDVGEMPLIEVACRLAELEQLIADDGSDVGGTANIEAGTAAREDQLCTQ